MGLYWDLKGLNGIMMRHNDLIGFNIYNITVCYGKSHFLGAMLNDQRVNSIYIVQDSKLECAFRNPEKNI
jgi:hypothetical protein